MNKQQTTFNASDVYDDFVKKLLASNPNYWQKNQKDSGVYCNTGKEVVEIINFARWFEMVKLYFLLGRQKVIRGGRFKLGKRLGSIQARTIARNFKNKQINWAETKKQPWVTDPITGKQKRAQIIYHLSEEYSRIAWEKLRSIPNESYYIFKPAKGNSVGKGFGREFSAALKADPLLARKYKQFRNELSIN